MYYKIYYKIIIFIFQELLFIFVELYELLILFREKLNCIKKIKNIW